MYRIFKEKIILHYIFICSFSVPVIFASLTGFRLTKSSRKISKVKESECRVWAFARTDTTKNCNPTMKYLILMACLFKVYSSLLPSKTITTVWVFMFNHYFLGFHVQMVKNAASHTVHIQYDAVGPCRKPS